MSRSHLMPEQMSFRIKLAYQCETPIRSRTASLEGSQEPNDPITMASTNAVFPSLGDAQQSGGFCRFYAALQQQEIQTSLQTAR
ncbi:hypothetical protein NPIL_435871 [Nephila pilipes]|uniref:Uncharacterized protein n=1 Tax=Nephila pilipes TaxID=299642 RepID=A0A8X6QIB7_NEPPI|nr:hypothetical protein NPIL_435871 [Nephila pilipes]